MLTLIQSIFEIQIMLQSVSRLTAIVLPNGCCCYYYYYIIAVLKYGPDTTPSKPPHTPVNTWLLVWPSELQRQSQDPSGTFFLENPTAFPSFSPIITPRLKTASEIWGKAQPDCLKLTQPQREKKTLLLLSHNFPLLGRQPLLSLATRKPNERQRKS